MNWCIVALLNDDVALRVAPIVRYLKRISGEYGSLILLRPKHLSGYEVGCNFDDLALNKVRCLPFSSIKHEMAHSKDTTFYYLVKQPVFNWHNILLLILYLLCRSEKMLVRFNVLLLRKCLASADFLKRERQIACLQTLQNSMVDVFINLAGYFYGLLIRPLLKKRRQNTDLSSVKSILFVRMDHLGDVICTLPSLKALRRSCPEVKITVLAAPWSSQPLKANKELYDRLWEWKAPWHEKELKFIMWPSKLCSFLKIVGQIRAERFDLIIQPRGDKFDVSLAAMANAGTSISGVRMLRPAIRSMFAYIDRPIVHSPFKTYHISEWSALAVKESGAKVCKSDERGFFESSQHECFSAVEIIRQKRNCGFRVLALVMGAGGKPRELSALKYRNVIRRLAKENIYSVLIGAPGDIEKSNLVADMSEVECLNMTGKTGFENLPALIREVDIVVSPDTSMTHLASLLGKPVVTFFSSGNLSLARPVFAEARIIKSELGCSGCGDRCMFGHRYPCIEMVNSGKICAAVFDFFEDGIHCAV